MVAREGRSPKTLIHSVGLRPFAFFIGRSRRANKGAWPMTDDVEELQPDLPPFSIKGWCEYHDFSPTTFFKLQQEGKAPRTYRVGNRKRITRAADRKWVREREAEEASEAGQLAATRRRELALQASKAAKESPKHLSNPQSPARVKLRRQGKRA
jgi:hypothetical protein